MVPPGKLAYQWPMTSSRPALESPKSQTQQTQLLPLDVNEPQMRSGASHVWGAARVFNPDTECPLWSPNVPPSMGCGLAGCLRAEYYSFLLKFQGMEVAFLWLSCHSTAEFNIKNIFIGLWSRGFVYGHVRRVSSKVIWGARQSPQCRIIQLTILRKLCGQEGACSGQVPWKIGEYQESSERWDGELKWGPHWGRSMTSVC